jgi:hypothetical protein
MANEPEVVLEMTIQDRPLKGEQPFHGDEFHLPTVALSVLDKQPLFSSPRPSGLLCGLWQGGVAAGVLADAAPSDPPLTKTKVARVGGNGVLRRTQTRALLSRLRALVSEAVPCQRGDQKMDGRAFEAWGSDMPADAHWMPGGRGGRWKNENHTGA